MDKKKKSIGVSSKRGQRVAPSMQVQNCHSCQLLINEDSQGYADRERMEDRMNKEKEFKPIPTILRIGLPRGCFVHYKELSGKQYEGTLYEWDSNVAHIKCDDGIIRKVEC